MNITNIASSTLKVVASENLDISTDLAKADSTKTLNELLHEEKEKTEKPTDKRD